MEKIVDTQLFEKIKPLKNFGIGLHGIRTFCTEGKNETEVAKLIMENGLILGENYGSINGNVASIGISGMDDANITEKLQNYCWGNKQFNIIVAYPPIIENSAGEKLYLGYTKSPNGQYDQNTACSLMDQACSGLRYIPKEFILGYYEDSQEKFGTTNEGEHITYIFEANPEFCNGQQVSDELFNAMAKYCDKSLSNQVIEAIDKLDTNILKTKKTSQNQLYQLFGNLDFLYQVCDEAIDRIEKLKENPSLTLEQLGKSTVKTFTSNPEQAYKVIDDFKKDFEETITYQDRY